jgi:hypothetical protein
MTGGGGEMAAAPGTNWHQLRKIISFPESQAYVLRIFLVRLAYILVTIQEDEMGLLSLGMRVFKKLN